MHISSHCQDFKGGIILGLSTSQVSGDNLAGFNKAGLILGGFTSRTLSNINSLQLEIVFIQKGSRNPNILNQESINYGRPYISLSYIEIPILLKLNYSNTLEYELGAQWAQLINGYYSDNIGEINSTIDPFIKNDLSIVLGINYFISQNISLNSRLTNSILPIGNEDYDNSTIYNSNKKGKYNTTINFSIYYYI
tara:strand:+ start:1282 stop:1863 length:582 start_codon:yes stop_codon:yes gene_type:complete